jgi:succinoglycan biosynthesis protein ExoM
METRNPSPNQASDTSTMAALPPDVVAKPTPHICVCICTYKRPQLLRRLLGELADQETNGLFGYSIVVADNDHLRSAEAVVKDFAAASTIPVRYCVQPEQNISLTRNKAIANATGDFIAFIDDDEFPAERWLLTLFEACGKYGADGVLGPVKCHFDENPPRWVIKGKFYERPTYPTGFVIDWTKGRTGNVLLRRQTFDDEEAAFSPEFHRAGDQDFFRRMIAKGRIFIWCDEAVAYEVVPPVRWTRTFMLKRALLRGTIGMQHPTSRWRRIAKAVIAVPVYTIALPFSLMLGHHRFMYLLIRLCDHLASLLTFVGIKPVRSQLITD